MMRNSLSITMGIASALNGPDDLVLESMAETEQEAQAIKHQSKINKILNKPLPVHHG